MKEEIELTEIEKCLIVLAQYIDRCPYNDYDVEGQILEELGYEKKKKTPAKRL